MKPKKPRLRFLLYASCLVAFGAIGFVFDFMPPVAVFQTLFYGTVMLVVALFLYRFEWKKYRVYQATPPPEEDPTP